MIILFSFQLDENAIHIGGVKVTNDPRFTDYDHFDGCLSSKKFPFPYSEMWKELNFSKFKTIDVVVELDGNELHPLLAYLGYQRSELEAVTSLDPEGKAPRKFEFN